MTAASRSANGFVWYELLSEDPAAAADFYSAVTGWTPKVSEMPGMDYTVFHRDDDTAAAGLMAMPAEAKAGGARPAWTGYVHVDDTDAAVAAFVEAGGQVIVPAMEVPQVGRFATLADPQGAAIAVMHFEGGDEANTGRSDPAICPWRELHGTDGKAAFDFYTSVFDWKAAGEMDTPAGPYRMFSAGGEEMAGGMMTKMHDGPPFWLYYFAVPALNAAVAAATGRGAKVMREAMEVPGGSWIAQLVDPEGA
ncbi:MAG: VOC family protein, partial [Alphaproteobacteria bacterium]